MTIFVNIKGIFETGIATANKSVGFDPNAIILADSPCVQISWEDEGERAYRLQYQAMREKGELVWDCSGEREAQERARARTDARKHQPVTWDDADERACMESYRNKYKK